VDIEYSTRRLAAASVSIAESIRLFGVPTGRKYIQRITILRAIDKFNQLYGYRALQFHQLKGDRVGQYAINLTGNYRLILENIREDKILIVGVEDYHGD
jgi:proteic killer suppression protein